MVTFNVGEKYWEEDQFDCKLTRTGKRQLNELSRRLMGEPPYDTEDQMWTIDEGLERMGLESLGSGKTRVVVFPKEEWMKAGSASDCVVKVQWDRHYRQNWQEVEIWTNANGSQASVLLPILDWEEATRNWILVPRAETAWEMTAKERNEMLSEIKSEARNQGIKTSDLRLDNVGMIGNKAVIIDYGVMELR
jgi:hypothetical protein